MFMVIEFSSESDSAVSQVGNVAAGSMYNRRQNDHMVLNRGGKPSRAHARTLTHSSSPYSLSSQTIRRNRASSASSKHATSSSSDMSHFQPPVGSYAPLESFVDPTTMARDVQEQPQSSHGAPLAPMSAYGSWNWVHSQDTAHGLISQGNSIFAISPQVKRETGKKQRG